MRTFSRLQVASGIALLVSVMVVLAVHVWDDGPLPMLYSAALVCVFGFLFLSSDGAPQEDEPWWW